MIELSRVWKIKEGVAILEDVDLAVGKGEFVLLVGPNGAGKSTIMRLIHFDELPTRGRVRVGAYDSSRIRRRDLPYLRRKIGVIFQDFKLLRDRNVFDNVAFALQVTGERPSTLKRRVVETLALVKMGHKRNTMPHQLSGGEQQRVAIARALVHEPEVLLADEPTGNLDPDAAVGVMEMLQEIHHGGTSVVMATHDAGLVGRTAHRVVRVEGGRLQKA